MAGSVFLSTKHASMRRGRQLKNTPLWGVPPKRKTGDVRVLDRLGFNIQSERLRIGMTQEKLAELVDLHPRIVQKIEAGELNPKTTTTIRIQAALGCSWESIMAGLPVKRQAKPPS